METGDTVSSSDGEEKAITLAQPFCGSMDTVNALALADTVNDLIPNNQITRYLKSKYETDSLQSVDNAEDDEYTFTTLHTGGNTLGQATNDNTLDDTLADTLDNTVDHSCDSTLDKTFDDTKDVNEDEDTILPIENDVEEDGNTPDGTVDRLLNDAFDNALDGTLQHSVDENLECPYDEGFEAWHSAGSVKIAMMYSLASKMDSSEIKSDLEASSKAEMPAESLPPQKGDRVSNDDASEGLNTTMDTTFDSATTFEIAPWTSKQDSDQDSELPPPPPPLPPPGYSESSTVSRISGSAGGTPKDWGVRSNSYSTASYQRVGVIGKAVGEGEKAKTPMPFIRILSRFETVEEETVRVAREKRYEEMKAVLQVTEKNPTGDIEKKSETKKGRWKKGLKAAKKAMKKAFRILKKKAKPGGRPDQDHPTKDAPNEDGPIANEDIANEQDGQSDHSQKKDTSNEDGPNEDIANEEDGPSDHSQKEHGHAEEPVKETGPDEEEPPNGSGDELSDGGGHDVPDEDRPDRPNPEHAEC